MNCLTVLLLARDYWLPWHGGSGRRRHFIAAAGRAARGRELARLQRWPGYVCADADRGATRVRRTPPLGDTYGRGTGRPAGRASERMSPSTGAPDDLCARFHGRWKRWHCRRMASWCSGHAALSTRGFARYPRARGRRPAGRPGAQRGCTGMGRVALHSPTTSWRFSVADWQLCGVARNKVDMETFVQVRGVLFKRSTYAY